MMRGRIWRYIAVFAVRADGLVLPRVLRRVIRAAERYVGGDVAAPRFAATALTVGLLGASGLYGMIVGGHVPSVLQAVTARAGFAVDEVTIGGHEELSEIDIIEQLGLDGWTSMIGLDADAARSSILGLPWVESASVRKIYPDRLDIQVTEREPFAIWQHGRQLTLIDAAGEVIAPYRGGRHAALPLVVGMGAPESAPQFVARMRRFPDLAARVMSYIRIADRRWDVRLDNGVTVRLPEHGIDAAIADLAALDRRHGLLSRDIRSLDMRLPDRLVVQLAPEAALAREAALKQRGKSSGRAKESI